MSATQPLARWVVRWQAPQGAPRLRLLCFPHAGGGASAFRTWPRGLPPGVELCAVQLPGRESRLAEEPRSELGPLVAELTETLAPLLDTRYVLFGHSLGGLIAFELARALRRTGLREPNHLLVSATRAPQLPEREPPIHALPAQEFVAALRRYNGTPPAVLEDEELLELVLPALRADFALIERYVYEPAEPLRVPITAFYGDADDGVLEADAAAWARQTSGEFALRRLPGDHFFLRTAEAELLAAISAAAESLLEPRLREPTWA